MKWIAALTLILGFGAQTLAGESGYLRNGQSIAVFRDGKKVGEWPKDEDKKERTPSSVRWSNSDDILWEDDGPIRCYRLFNPGAVAVLSCVKK